MKETDISTAVVASTWQLVYLDFKEALSTYGEDFTEGLRLTLSLTGDMLAVVKSVGGNDYLIPLDL